MPAVQRRFLKQVLLAAYESLQRGDQFFPYRVQRRVGNLREQLLEVVKKGTILVGKHREGRVVAHGADCLISGGGHGRSEHPQLFDGVSERPLLLPQIRAAGRWLRRGFRKIVQRDLVLFQPFTIRLLAGERVLQLLVANYPPLIEADQEHPARLQPALFLDALWRKVQHARLRRHHEFVVVSDGVAERAQAVAIEHGAHVLAVGCQHHRRPVPGLHHAGMELVKVLLFL